MTAGMNQQSMLKQSEIILERFGKTEDMGALAIYLISKAGAYLDGSVHVTDGGRLALFASSF